VIDGDTIVIVGKHVRLQSIDAPETNKPVPAYGEQERAAEWQRSG
jgi:endonuclease YncB( thermonuclease family)